MREVFELGKVDIHAAGEGCKILLGDVNGDGRMELVCVQADGGIDDRFIPHQITCVTVFDLEGNLLWQVGTPVEIHGGFGSDFPAQVYDIDADGSLEVLCVMNKKFLILDGADGSVKNTYDLPDEYAHDCIIIANLSGNETARDIILKNRYHKMWAMGPDFQLLWTHEGNIGHFPWPCDINGDGKDEVMAGYDLLSSEGKVLWSCKDLDDHADCLLFGDVNGDGKPELVVGGSVTCLYDANGKELWRYDGCVESQHVALGKFCKDLPGLQIAGLDRIIRGDGHKGQWDGKDGMFLIGSDGKELWKEDRKTKGWLTIVESMQNWNGEDQDYILAYRRGGGLNPTLYDGNMVPVITFPIDGYVIHADLFGRGREDVIIYANGSAHLYSGTTYDLSTKPSGICLPQPSYLYRSTLYPGAEYTNI